MKLGSLFSGSGGFELAGSLNGVEPVWCSEIEPYPIAVTRSRFPSMKHYGDVSKVNGAEVEPVDIITFGSPCQDLSIAGKREGIEDGARSSLFFQAVRIIKEMREATHGEYPRFAVWENVPGAFSSNKGNDFRLVLEALASVSEPEVSIPVSEKWQRAGEIVGNGWSIAWRILDAQYWGVPQRRKRIYLVADFGGERAGDILFKPDSLLGYPAQSQSAGQGTAADAPGSAGGSDGVHCLTPWDCQSKRLFEPDGVWPTLPAMGEGGANNSAVVYPQVARTLEARHDSSPCIDRGQNLLVLKERAGCEGGGDTRNDDGSGKGLGVSEEGVQYTLTGADRHGAAYAVDCRNATLNEELMPTLQAKENGGQSLNYQAPVMYAVDALSSNSMKSSNPNSGFHVSTYAKCLDTSDQNPSKNQGGNILVVPVVYPTVTGTLCASGAGTQRPAGQANEGEPCVVFSRQRSDELVENNVSSCQSARQYKDATDLVGANARPPRKYIVRRLTPIEAARLQGFPDTWGDLAPYNGDDAFWQSVYKTACEIKGGKFTPKKDLRKWYNGLRTDSAEYRMWGNGIALPCAEFVLRSIVDEMNPGAWLY